MTRASPLLDILKSGVFIISVQIDPPTKPASDLSLLLQRLRDIGIKVIDINSSRRLSADSLHLGSWAQRLGFQSIPHLTARDSTLSGLVNQVYGAYTFGGIRDVLIVTGDPYEAGHTIEGDNAGIFAANALGIIKALHQKLREELGLCVTLGAAINQNVDDLLKEAMLIKLKAEAGADFFMSQPVFSESDAIDLSRFHREHSDRPLLMGIWPLINRKTIENIAQGKIVGVRLPRIVLAQSRNYNNEAALALWGELHALELVHFIKNQKLAEGVYIVAPTRNPWLIMGFIEATAKL